MNGLSVLRRELWVEKVRLFRSLIFSRFFFIERRSALCSPRLHIFDQKYSKNSNIVQYYNLKILQYYNLK